ncbi:hypothetical protein VCR19J5_530007 [Vibrio crassostreae]|nr:hypothetical protein VCRA213O314_370008 [Vibrio crassostreae]CDT44741.1 hypothetical protein VCR19J5_530007 [Vibrio crassostreae]CDT48360.1 hypothetical protein VCR9J2_720007 [Vibrio crassostreae]
MLHLQKHLTDYFDYYFTYTGGMKDLIFRTFTPINVLITIEVTLRGRL